MNTLSIIEEFKVQKNYSPTVINYLGSQDIPTTFGHYKLRHPGGIFNAQFNNLARSLIDVLNDLPSIKTEAKTNEEKNVQNEHIGKLKKDYIFLLYQFNCYIESCYEIFIAICPKHSPPQETDKKWSWLKSKGYAEGQNFYNATKKDAEYFRNIFNELKHSSSDLRIMSLKHEPSNVEVPGYYIESATYNGTVGPNTSYHPEFKGMLTANSFNRDLRLVYFAMYKTATVLERCIIKHFKQIYKKDLTPIASLGSSIRFQDLYEKINSLGSLLFPNEYIETTPFFSLLEQENLNILQALKTDNKLPTIGTFQFSVTSDLDGFTRGFGIPYIT